MAAGNRVLNLLCSNISFFDAEKRIANYILLHQNESVNMTQAALAGASGTSEATVSRFCKKLGFDGYRSFQLALARDIAEEHQPSNISNEISLEHLDQSLQNILTNKINELTATINAIDTDTLKAVLALFQRAELIEIAAVGNTIPVALDASFKFNQLGLRCVTSEIVEKQSAFALALSPRDLLVIISHSGRSRRLLQIARAARANGTPIVLISNDPSTLLAKQADYIFFSTNRESLLTTREFCFSRISAIAIIEVLYHFLLVSLPSARQNIRLHEEIMRPDKQME